MNNRLKHQRAYLAGAIDRVPDRGTTWRDNITPFLEEMDIVVFNPMIKPINIGLENTDVQLMRTQLKSQGKYDEFSKIMKTIRAVDLRLVDISDFLIVNLDINTHPCGTLEEIFWANRQKKPIVIHMEQGKQNIPDWLFGAIPHQMFFSTWDEIKAYLVSINTLENIETYNRWYCFAS